MAEGSRFRGLDEMENRLDKLDVKFDELKQLIMGMHSSKKGNDTATRGEITHEDEEVNIGSNCRSEVNNCTNEGIFPPFNYAFTQAPQMFDKSPVMNFYTTHTPGNYTSPYTLSVQTTLSTGQFYYALEPTTMFENSFGKLSPGSESLNIRYETEVAEINMKIVGEAGEVHSRTETDTEIAYKVEAINDIGNEIELKLETDKSLEVVMEETVLMKYVSSDPVKEDDEVKKSSEKKANKQKSKAQPSNQANGVSKLPQTKKSANEVTSDIVINLNSQTTFLSVDSSHGMSLQKTLESKSDVVTTRSLLEVMKFDPSHDWGDAEPAKKNHAHVQIDRLCMATKGQKVQLLTNYFKVNLTNIDRYFSHYSVALCYEDGRPVAGIGIETEVLECYHYDTYIVELKGKDLSDKGRTLPRYKMKFIVVLEDNSLIRSYGNCSLDYAHENDKKRLKCMCHSKMYKEEISSAAACSAISQVFADLPAGPHTMIEMLIVSDIQDVYIPLHSDIFVQLSIRRANSRTDYQSLLPSSVHRNSGAGPHIPVHSFGFGADHDPVSMHSISEASGETFPFIETESVIQDAFAQCIGGLLSVVVQELQVIVDCVNPKLHLNSIKAGNYKTTLTADARTGFIEAGDLYAEEERDFLVILDIVVDKYSSDMTLLKIKCHYKDPITKETVTLEEAKNVVIQRPEITGQLAVSMEVDRRRNRLCAAEAMTETRAAAERGDVEILVRLDEEVRREMQANPQLVHIATTYEAEVMGQEDYALEKYESEMEDSKKRHLNLVFIGHIDDEDFTIINTIGIGVEEENLKRIWVTNAEKCKKRGSIKTISAIYAHALAAFKLKTSIWINVGQLESSYGTIESFDALLRKAVTYRSQADVLWLIDAKEKWLAGIVTTTREFFCIYMLPSQILMGFGLLYLCWNFKKRKKKMELEGVGMHLAKIQEKMKGTQHVWMKFVIAERELGKHVWTAKCVIDN